MGRGVPRDVRATGFSAALFCAGFITAAGLVFVLFRSYLPWFYVSDRVVVEMSAALLVIVAFFQISDGIQAVGLGILRGITDMKIPTFIALVAYWIIGLP